MGRLLNPLLWRLANQVIGGALVHRINRQRSRCGLSPKLSFDFAQMEPTQRAVVAVSPSLFARPADWPETIQVGGFLSLPESAERWTPEGSLDEFLAEGAPVFASFGSMFTINEAMATSAVEVFVGAAARAATRMIIQCPAAVRARAPRNKDIYYIERAPHGQLFPKCSVIVHHGGAGTTQSSLLARKPSVVVPHAADQFYWGDALFARGVAARPLRRPALAVKPLAERLQWILQRPAITTAAEQIGAQLANEDGCSRIASMVERAVETPHK